MATTQAIGDNSTSIATTAFVLNYFSPPVFTTILTTGTTFNYTIPAQTAMKACYFIQPSASTTINITVTAPSNATLYIGQEIYIGNIYNGTKSINILRAGSESMWGSGTIDSGTTAANVLNARQSGVMTWINNSSYKWLWRIDA